MSGTPALGVNGTPRSLILQDADLQRARRWDSDPPIPGWTVTGFRRLLPEAQA